MIKRKPILARVLLPIKSSSIQPLHFLLYPSILTCLIYPSYHLLFALHLLPPLHSLFHQPLHLLFFSIMPVQCSKKLMLHIFHLSLSHILQIRSSLLNSILRPFHSASQLHSFPHDLLQQPALTQPRYTPKLQCLFHCSFAGPVPRETTFIASSLRH